MNKLTVNDLHATLNVLYELNGLRDRAKELREQGRLALKGIQGISSKGEITRTVEENDKDQDFYKTWIASGDRIETALLVKVQNHMDLSENDKENDSAEASSGLIQGLIDIEIESLFPNTRSDIGQERVPVLVAARTMQALIRRAKLVFSPAAMVCYYRVVRELYVADGPDWTIGAARAGVGGGTSAFVTGECIRAILAFDGAIRRTIEFFKNTNKLIEKHEFLRAMLKPLDNQGTAGHPLGKWADKAIQRMWLDWYISTNRRRGEIALYDNEDRDSQENRLLPPQLETVDMETVGEYIKSLSRHLEESTETAKKGMQEARAKIDEYRTAEKRCAESSEEVNRRYLHTESAHGVALRVVARGVEEAEKASRKFFRRETGEAVEITGTLNEFIDQFETISHRIHELLEPAKHYVRTVVNRELANATTGRFDAGELAFAAASFGAATNWKPNERLVRVCDLLNKALPDNGSLPTRRPFHSNTDGYRLMPIGCEMTRSFAQLLQKTNYELEPELVRRMLSIFDEKTISLSSSSKSEKSKKRVAWNFEGAPSPGKACVWVTAVTVMALDRIVRMLNERINTIVLKHFEVIRPDKPHTKLSLNDLLYPDYGFSEYYQDKDLKDEPSIAIRLEQMRAHIMRVILPETFNGKKMEKVFSAILYGPPGTGKTTFVESLALSSNAPLIRLSPSDLSVQGHELIEGRARSVFEALSMLTQAVIILDEFEPVLRNRKSDSVPDDPTLKFLVTGMLPKLVKLHDAAKNQSLVYCLATNHMEQIDDAARRIGRFDKHIPINNPDPLSRAGAFLYRFQEYKHKHKSRGTSKTDDTQGIEQRVTRLLKMVARTADMPASELAGGYFKLEENSQSLDYYLGDHSDEPSTESSPKLEIPKEEVDHLSEEERKGREWIFNWERKLRQALGRKPSKGVINPLEHYLTPDP
ncbi:MAG TPA: AAA family ATPase [Blastocatellia bacterium]|nr:AAA family ATPase [Blastocatellia bacterium]